MPYLGMVVWGLGEENFFGSLLSSGPLSLLQCKGVLQPMQVLLWMDKILHHFSDTSFCVPRAPFLTLAVKS